MNRLTKTTLAVLGVTAAVGAASLIISQWEYGKPNANPSGNSLCQADLFEIKDGVFQYRYDFEQAVLVYRKDRFLQAPFAPRKINDTISMDSGNVLARFDHELQEDRQEYQKFTRFETRVIAEARRRQRLEMIP